MTLFVFVNYFHDLRKSTAAPSIVMFYANGSTLLKEPRTIVYEQPLKVVS